MSEQLSKGTWLTWKQSNLPAIMNSHYLPLNVRTNVDLSLARQRESRDISWETLPAASGGNFLWWEILQVRQCWRCAPGLRPAASSRDKSAVSWRKKINLIKKSLPRKIATFGNKRDHSFLHQWQSPKSRKEKPCLRSYWGKNLKTQRVSRRMEGSRRSTYIHAAFCPAPQKLTKTVGRNGAKLTLGVDYMDFGLWRK